MKAVKSIVFLILALLLLIILYVGWLENQPGKPIFVPTFDKANELNVLYEKFGNKGLTKEEHERYLFLQEEQRRQAVEQLNEYRNKKITP